MKKYFQGLIIVLFILVAVMVYAGGNVFTLRLRPLNTNSIDGVGAGVTTRPSGTSYFRTLNLNNPHGHGPVDGTATFSIIEMVQNGQAATDDDSAVTVSFFYRQSPIDMADAAWSLTEQQAIVENLLVKSGNTRYSWPLSLDLQQYLKLEVDSGITGARMTIGLTFQNP